MLQCALRDLNCLLLPVPIERLQRLRQPFCFGNIRCYQQLVGIQSRIQPAGSIQPWPKLKRNRAGIHRTAPPPRRHQKCCNACPLVLADALQAAPYQ